VLIFFQHGNDLFRTLNLNPSGSFSPHYKKENAISMLLRHDKHNILIKYEELYHVGLIVCGCVFQWEGGFQCVGNTNLKVKSHKF